ncbi:MAG: DNA polymerase III subunit beta, partial [Pseudomonadota bacterium]|nr:DNA polymerase III subunit beta [Pseudomonadota bacterium]
MKLNIERAALFRSLGHVQSIVERRNTIPILSNVLLTSDSGQLSLTATDMDIAIVEGVDATIGTSGSTTAPAHTLYDIVRKLPDGAQIELDSGNGDGQMTIRAGRSEFTLQTLPTEDFPQTDGGDLPHQFVLSAAELRGLIDRTRFAISTEETRYYLNGIFMHTTSGDGGEVMRTVATDGHRLARVEMRVPEGATGMPGIIVPRKTVNELRKLIDEISGNISVALSDTSVRFAFGGAVLTSKLIDGTFPDYERVIPTENDKSLNVDCRSFADAVDRVATISTEKSRAVKLAAGNNNLVLTASSPDSGTAREEIEVDYNDSEIEIGFNARYLLDIAQQIEGDEAEFVVADAASPTI